MIALANFLNTYCDKTERSHSKTVRERLEKSVDRCTILVIEFTENEELILLFLNLQSCIENIIRMFFDIYFFHIFNFLGKYSNLKKDLILIQ